MTTIRELAEVIQTWHTNATGSLQKIIDTPADTEIRLGEGPDAIALTGDKAKGFRMGIAVAQSFFAKLPFSIDTTVPADPVARGVIEIIAGQMGLSVDEVTPDKNISDDLGADSLDQVEMIMAVEEHFMLGISDEDAEKIKTVQDAIDLVTSCLAD